MLQKIGTDLLPEKIVKRKKFPWGIPFYEYFRVEFLPIAKTVIEESIRNKRSYLNTESLKINVLSERILNTGIKYNLKPRLHADEFIDSGAAEPAAPD